MSMGQSAISPTTCYLLKILTVLTHLTVNRAVIHQGPRDSVTIEGGIVVFSCADTDPNLYWLKTKPSIDHKVINQYTMPNAAIYTVGATSFLNITDISLEDEGTYVCAIGEESRKGTLTVESPSQLILEPGNNPLSLVVNESTEITCKGTDAKPSINITWYLNGEQVDSSHVRQNIEESAREKTKNTISVFTFMPTKSDDSIKCKSSGSGTFQPKSLQAKLNILYPPSCEVTVVPKTVSMASVHCICDGNPFVKEEDCSIRTDKTIRFDGTFSVNITSTSNVNISCLGKNSVGFSESAPKVFYGIYGHKQDETTSSVGLIICFVAAGVISLAVFIGIVVLLKYRKSQKQHSEEEGTPDQKVKKGQIENVALLDENSSKENQDKTEKERSLPKDDSREKANKTKEADKINPAVEVFSAGDQRKIHRDLLAIYGTKEENKDNDDDL